jgi:hypothetical protein
MRLISEEEFERLKKLADEAIEKAVMAHSIAINDLTEAQTVQVFKQAIACGDISRLVRVDNHAQKVIYIPFARAQQLEGKLESAKECLRTLRDWDPDNIPNCLKEKIDACLMP